ncbi:hypothetical protein DVH24_036957 [Malus domestica]|uniref:Uncharacterized protein n=1 Tax=Malus domestica TaxID=3750 RepID=A0A498IGW3_MALDO|nr:hypothetical protein DVH24_036957 [Malus domestica]
MYAFECLNRIYEAGLGFPEFRALYLLKKGDIHGPHILMIPATLSAIFDPARFVRIVRAHLTDCTFTIADVGDVVALVDGGTNVEELTPELTGGVELEDVGIQSIGMDLKLWRPAAVPCLTPVPEVGRHRCNATSGQDSNLIVTSVMDKGFRVKGLRVKGLGFKGLRVKGLRGSGFRVQGSGFRVQGSGFRVQGSGFRVQGSGFRVQGSGFRVQGSGFRVQGSGFRVQGSGFRVQGSGFRVQGSGLGFRV